MSHDIPCHYPLAITFPLLQTRKNSDTVNARLYLGGHGIDGAAGPAIKKQTERIAGMVHALDFIAEAVFFEAPVECPRRLYIDMEFLINGVIVKLKFEKLGKKFFGGFP